MPEAENRDAARVCVGVVIGAHGVRGQVRLKSFTAAPEDIAAYGPVSDEAGRRTFAVSVVGVTGKGVVLAELRGVHDRDAALALKGLRLYVPRSALPPPDDDDEFYWADLIGLAVELDDGTPAGRVRAVHDFGAGTMLEVAGEGRGTVMLPFTRAAVPVVDVAGGRLVAARDSGVFDPPRPEDRESMPEDRPEDRPEGGGDAATEEGEPRNGGSG